jgi:hypothetical protein
MKARVGAENVFERSLRTERMMDDRKDFLFPKRQKNKKCEEAACKAKKRESENYRNKDSGQAVEKMQSLCPLLCSFRFKISLLLPGTRNGFIRPWKAQYSW